MGGGCTWTDIQNYFYNKWLPFSLCCVNNAHTNVLLKSYHSLSCLFSPQLQIHQLHHCPFSFFDCEYWNAGSSGAKDPFLELCGSDGMQEVSVQTDSRRKEKGNQMDWISTSWEQRPVNFNKSFSSSKNLTEHIFFQYKNWVTYLELQSSVNYISYASLHIWKLLVYRIVWCADFLLYLITLEFQTMRSSSGILWYLCLYSESWMQRSWMWTLRADMNISVVRTLIKKKAAAKNIWDGNGP